MKQKLRWMFSNRVLAEPVTCEGLGASRFHEGDWVAIGARLRRVWRHDHLRHTIYLY